MTKVSIIVPTLNEEKYLPQLLESIKTQDFSDYEIIIADAGSTDKTVEIAKSYGAIIVKGGSAAEGRNNGAKIAKGDFLFFFDSDIIIPASFLENTYHEMLENYIDLATPPFLPISEKAIDKMLYSIANTYLFLNQYTGLPQAPGWAILVSKRLFERTGGFNEEMQSDEDQDFIVRASKFRPLRVLRSASCYVSVRRLNKEDRTKLRKKYMLITLPEWGKEQEREDDEYEIYKHIEATNAIRRLNRLQKKKALDYLAEVGKLKADKSVGISCVIPAWNEEKGISSVLDMVKSYPYFDEIIVVDDGSTDKTTEIVKEYQKESTHLRLIVHEKNKGKTGAIITGIDSARYPLIVMVDADLLSLTFTHISELIYYVINGQYEMTILDRGSDRRSALGWFQSVWARLMGGERAFWKEDFKKLKLNGNERYGLEVIMNQYYVNNDKRVRTIYAPDLTSFYQFKKRGFFKGIQVYSKMFKEMMGAVGFRNFAEQATTIEEDRLEPLYDMKKKSKIKGAASLAIVAAGLALSTYTFFALNAKRNKKK
jgi:glycosyltransferase involved in cell wall biosynthesis